MNSHLKLLQMKKLTIIFYLLTISMYIPAANRLDSLLIVLDDIIDIHHIYTKSKENRLEELKRKISSITSPELTYDLNMQLFLEYKSYICDSAIHYMNNNIELAEMMKDPFRIYESKLSLSYLLSSSGMYKEAMDLVESIDRSNLPEKLLTDYYLAYDHTYGELAYYTQDERSSERYRKISSNYKDSLYAVIDKNTDRYLNMQETSYRDSGKYAEALNINNIRLSGTKFGTPEHALVTFYRALDFREAGNREMQKYFLTLSSLSDIHSATKDHASLWMLAQLLYEEGDLERAYRYIRFSWTETVFYNARLRSLQSAGILSLIDDTYQAMIEKQNKELQRYILLISILMVLLVSAFVYIYRQMKKLAAIRNNLQEVNNQLKDLNEELKHANQCLQATNMELSESNLIKEEYIGRFIKLCSTYINKLDAYRRMVNKKISGGQTAELFKITRSQDALEDELKELYRNFDSAFLQLFPDFVTEFNNLLQEEDKIVLKKGELLNTELRIFALIRLGIDDSSQIAEFLRYSVNTIYNYRAKVKNKARVSREDFESLIMMIR